MVNKIAPIPQDKDLVLLIRVYKVLEISSYTSYLYNNKKTNYDWLNINNYLCVFAVCVSIMNSLSH